MLFPESAGGGGNPGAAIAAFEMLGHGDLSLLVKCGVQFGLFGGAVQHLGNEEHHERYLGDIATGRAARLLRDDGVGPRLERAGRSRRPRPTTTTRANG